MPRPLLTSASTSPSMAAACTRYQLVETRRSKENRYFISTRVYDTQKIKSFWQCPPPCPKELKELKERALQRTQMRTETRDHSPSLKTRALAVIQTFSPVPKIELRRSNRSRERALPGSFLLQKIIFGINLLLLLQSASWSVRLRLDCRIWLHDGVRR
jgi:hypothetical protein